ncbi:MAG: cell division protein ZapD [Gammaproteobacteria bacterium]|nr:cell division protein ZapD [Gammaproteobacteria bacterium]
MSHVAIDCHQSSTLSPTHDVRPAAQSDAVNYELPLSERMRTFLRLEFLFTQINHHVTLASAWSTRCAIQALLDLLTILGRGDIRSELVKELESHINNMMLYRQCAEVNNERLHTLIDELKKSRSELSDTRGKVTSGIVEDGFLNAIRQRSTIPGGACEFDLPNYHYWLNRSISDRHNDLQRYIAKIQPIHSALEKILWLIRQTATHETVVANAGLLQKNLDNNSPLQLVRVKLNPSTDFYPEISGNARRISVRFYEWHDAHQRAKPALDDIEFSLALCR